MLRATFTLFFLFVLSCASFAGSTRRATIGLPIRFDEVVITGSEVEALPLDPKSPLHVRVVASRPHGDARRYDIECTAFEPGEFDARQGLRRKDGTPLSAVPELAFRAESQLESGLVRPATPRAGRVPNLGGYTTWMIVAGVVWVLGLAWYFLSSAKKARTDAAASVAPAPTLAERLGVLVERARRGELADAERSQLEMSLVAYWRKHLGLESKSSSELLPYLRAHAQAGPLLRGLEQWLHAPDGSDAVDIEALLAPYRELAADAIDLPRSA